MARIEHQTKIEEIIEEYAQLQHHHSDVEVQTIFDREHDHYQLVYVGWEGLQRTYGCVIHVDVKDGKFWIQHDGTEVGVSQSARRARGTKG